MTVGDQLVCMAHTFEVCRHLVNTKGRDYAPEDVIFLDIFEQAYELNTTPIEVLMGSHMRKHMVALRRYAQHDAVTSEPPVGRAQDLVVYSCMIAMFVEYELQMAEDVLEFNETRRDKCECHVYEECDKCRYAMWLRNYVTRLRSAAHSSSPRTPRVPD